MRLNQNPDPLTLKRLRKRCRRTQAQVYAQYADAAWTLARRLAGCEEMARDALQDAFVRAFERIDDFVGPDGFGAWLRRILVNRVMDLHRQRSRVTDLEGLPERWQDHGFGPALDLDAALARLDALDRQVIWLYDVEGLSHAEIAALNGQTLSWSKSRLSRARARMRALLQTDDERPARQARSHHG
ncbi:MAG: sigma-70 family RNA polymerase sigma factor [Wenzhouxiangella sp.]|nr:sigma-70 family RNA polymerase sigma factor [Wenzhouxiangella sp.]MCH8476781.1 sigma-70 family RNA polymerase sigma factor [Wenzhouxiangella sp.]